MATLLISEIFPPHTGGSGRWFFELYKRLSKDQFVVAAGRHPRQEWFDRTHDLRLFRGPLFMPDNAALTSLKSLRNYFNAIQWLGRIAKRESVRMIHSGRCLPEGWMALLLKWRFGIPFACYVHGEEVGYALSSREHTWMLHRVLRGAQFLIANSRNTERILREDAGVPAEKIRVLNPGVDTEKFAPGKRDLAVRKTLGWDDRPVILTVGRLQKRKGHDCLIAALTRIREVFPDVLYAIAGDGEERAHLEELVMQNRLEKNVRFLGECDDQALTPIYQQCDLFVLPNRAIGGDIEGFGIVLLEAQACGKAVVAGASGGTAETMISGESGVVVPCDEPGQLAKVLIELLSDPSRLARMGEAGRKYVVERFDWKALAAKAAAMFSCKLQE